jgi:hypothetical protein
MPKSEDGSVMSKLIFQSHSTPKREGLSWEQRWQDLDKGLITSWEVGRELANKKPELAMKAKSGELPALDWKGGTEKALQKNDKYGCLHYLAQWQGLRREDLDIDISAEKLLNCSRTGMKVTYTSDSTKVGKV